MVRQTVAARVRGAVPRPRTDSIPLRGNTARLTRAHLMPWALLAVLFFVDIAIWIITGFLRRDYSLSLTFFPLFYLILGVCLLRAPRQQRGHEGVTAACRTF